MSQGAEQAWSTNCWLQPTNWIQSNERARPVWVSGLCPNSGDACFEGRGLWRCGLRRPWRPGRRPNERFCPSALRSISSLRNKPSTPFTLRDDAPLLSPSNPDSCGSSRTAEEKYGAVLYKPFRDVHFHLDVHFLLYSYFYFIVFYS